MSDGTQEICSEVQACEAVSLAEQAVVSRSKVAQELGPRPDAGDPEDCAGLVAATVERWGGIDLLVCNVGSGASVRPGGETLAE